MVLAARAAIQAGRAHIHRLTRRTDFRPAVAVGSRIRADEHPGCFGDPTTARRRPARVHLRRYRHGKTTTARRLLIARTLTHGAGALLIDQKGDPVDELELRKLAAAAHRPFVLFDPRDPATDRWQPLWEQPADVAARAVEPIKRSEPYYADVLRQHLNLIVTVLHAADRWPPSFPFLVDAARADRYDTIQELVQDLDDEPHRHLQGRVKEHAEWVTSREGRRDLGGGLVRLELVMGAAWREVLTPASPPTARPSPSASSRRCDRERS